MEDSIKQGRLHYMCRNHLYSAVLTTSKGEEPSDRFYRGIGLLLMGRHTAATTIWEALKEDDTFRVAALAASVYISKRTQAATEETQQLETRLKAERKRAGSKQLLQAAILLHLLERNEKAREYAERVLSSSTSTSTSAAEALAIRGWIELHSGRTSVADQDYFSSALASDSLCLDAIMGRIEQLLHANKTDEALTLATRTYSKFSNLPELALEKIKCHLAARDWDSVSESLKKMSTSPGTGSLQIMVSHLQILVTICHLGSSVDAIAQLKSLQSLIDKLEPANGVLLANCARLFSRVCGRHLPILNECLSLANAAARADESSSGLALELGRQYAMQGRAVDCRSWCKQATKLNPSSVEAMLETAHCLLEDDDGDAAATAEQQIVVMEELHEAVQSHALYHLIKAKLLRRNPERRSESLRHLEQAYGLQVKRAARMYYGVGYLVELNPDLLLGISEEYLGREEEAAPLAQVAHLLKVITDACPALLPALYRAARVSYLLANYPASIETLQRIIDHVDPTFADAYLLLAKAHLKQERYSEAGRTLEAALSYNFAVRDWPAYHVLQARVHRHRADPESALSSLATAMSMAGMRPSSGGRIRTKGPPLNMEDKATVYLELFHTLLASGRKDEAGRIIDEASHQLKGSRYEGSIILAHVDYMVHDGDVEASLQQLQMIEASHPLYPVARSRMADIYLHQLRDERNYVRCFSDVARHQPTAANLTLLADAHVAVHQTDLAVATYEEALKLEPRNGVLATKIGSALIATHQYAKAINYYKDALRDPGNPVSCGLRHDFASLLLRLEHVDKAERVIREALLAEDEALPRDADLVSQQVRLLVLLVTLEEKRGKNALAILKRAKDAVSFLINRVAVEEAHTEHRKMATEIAMQMAAHYMTERDTPAAIRLYREALVFSPDHVGCMGQLAKVYLHNGEVEACQYMCKSLLKIDRDNDDAMLMVAQIALRRNDLDTAGLHFRQALERSPATSSYFDALSQFIVVCQRRGTLSDAEASVRAAELRAGVHDEPAAAFCRGLFEHLSGQNNAALIAFNRARTAAAWTQKALRYMLDICLSTDTPQLTGLATGVDDVASQYVIEDAELMALDVASDLLAELQPMKGDPLQTHVLYPVFYLLATRQKNNVEKALQDVTAFCANNNQQDNPAAIFALATGLVLLKQNQRARNHLKRFIKSSWSLVEAEYLEKCWLLLADIYVQNGKYDLAKELLRRVLTYNRSCAKAFEYLGYVLEKEQMFKDAALHFENAWKLTAKSNAVVGYKLAFCHLKAKMFSDAIDVCQIVLNKCPEHGRIRKDVLDKAIASLRA